MADRPGRDPGGRAARGAAESAELRRLRRRIDAVDRRIVRLLNERAELGREVGRIKARDGRRAIRDLEREREVLLRVAMANDGPLPQADLLAIYRRLIAATRALEARDRERGRIRTESDPGAGETPGPGGGESPASVGEPPGSAERGGPSRPPDDRSR